MVNTKADQEKDLVLRLKNNDRDAFAQLVDEHSSHIYNLAYRMMQDQFDAEEILQETFLQAIRHISNFRGESSLGTWLYRIAANQALMKMRRKERSDILLDLTDELDLMQVDLSGDWIKRPESELLDQEARVKLEDAIASLPDILRVVFILRDIENYSTAETAKALELSISAVKSRLLRARLHLRQKLVVYFSERVTEQ